jgi:hypothetical protein
MLNLDGGAAAARGRELAPRGAAIHVPVAAAAQRRRRPRDERPSNAPG